MNLKKNFNLFFFTALALFLFGAIYLSAQNLSVFTAIITDESGFFFSLMSHIFIITAVLSAFSGFLYLFFEQLEKTNNTLARNSKKTVCKK